MVKSEYNENMKKIPIYLEILDLIRLGKNKPVKIIKKTGADIKTVYTWLKKLEEMKLIYFQKGKKWGRKKKGAEGYFISKKMPKNMEAGKILCNYFHLVKWKLDKQMEEDKVSNPLEIFNRLGWELLHCKLKSV